MNARKTALVGLWALFCLLWIGGVVSHVVLGGPPEHVAWTAPLFIFVSGAIVAISADDMSRLRLCAVASVGLAAEISGVLTGFPFGSYTYRDALFPKVFGAPVAMAFAWGSLAAYTQQLVAPLQLPRRYAVPLFAVLLTGIDLVIDPLAAGPLGYWQWANTGVYYGIPATNFLGWLLVSATAALVMGRTGSRNAHHHAVGMAIIAFFTTLATIEGMLGAASIGIVLVTIGLWHARNASIRLGAHVRLAEQ